MSRTTTAQRRIGRALTRLIRAFAHELGDPAQLLAPHWRTADATDALRNAVVDQGRLTRAQVGDVVLIRSEGAWRSGRVCTVGRGRYVRVAFQTSATATVFLDCHLRQLRRVPAWWL